MKNTKEKQWEESKNTKQKKKEEMPKENGTWTIIGETKKNLKEKEEKGIIEIKRKTEMFLQRLKNKGYYNKTYDYSKVEYKDCETKILIIDEFDNEHRQTPSNMLRGYKLSYDSVINKTEYFLKELKIKNNYNEDYDYSKVKYITAHAKVIIIDKKYDTEHLIRPNKLLLRGDNCTIKNEINKNIYLKIRFNKVHNNNFDYSKVKYKGTHTKVIIICKKCNHEFDQTPHSHLMGASCPKCNGGILKLREEIIEQFNKIHGNEYDYSLFEYINSYTKGIIICKKYNTKFDQISSSHLNGSGCLKCGEKSRRESKRKNEKTLM